MEFLNQRPDHRLLAPQACVHSAMWRSEGTVPLLQLRQKPAQHVSKEAQKARDHAPDQFDDRPSGVVNRLEEN